MVLTLYPNAVLSVHSYVVPPPLAPHESIEQLRLVAATMGQGASEQRHGATDHCMALHCTALHCTALHCTALK